MRYPSMLLRFHRRLGYWPDAAWPRTHNERMLWRKIFDRNPEFVAFSDKVTAKALLAKRCPQLRQAGVLWVGEHADALPQAVASGGAILKFNKGSGTNLVVRDGVPARDESVHHAPMVAKGAAARGMGLLADSAPAFGRGASPIGWERAADRHQGARLR
ncbi:MAG: hypothetical protein IPK28_10300 [Devosia sp.]|nr:hypothetical protein [Devosia sp.]